MESSADVVTTILHHNSEDSIFVSGFDAPASYRRNISYFDATFQQIQFLKDRSSSCEQYLRVQCHEADGFAGSYWLDFHGHQQSYQLPVTMATGGCQCRMKKACQDGRQM